MPEFKSLGLVPLDRLVIGGWDVVSTSSVDRALELANSDGLFPGPLVESVRGELEGIDGRICPGFVTNGATSQSYSSDNHKESLSATVERLERDLENFRNENGLQHVIVVNLTPTEPHIAHAPGHEHLDGFKKLIEENQYSQLTPSILYAYIALSQGLPFVNFTASVSVTLPALLELARLREVPFCGSDGKTGETLLKAVLAPLFRSRNLEVLSWEGFNILGGGDGEVLNDPSSKRSKVESKERVLDAALGYRPHSGVFIEYVPSLGNWKTAWDFIHFRGFLGTKMSVQFTWQGCDAILAAPLVLDLVRLAEFSHRNGEVGALSHLACFFKNPLGTDIHSFPDQFRLLLDYAERHTCKVIP